MSSADPNLDPAGNGDLSSDPPDTASGGAPEQPTSPPDTEDPDGTPKENPSGG